MSEPDDNERAEVRDDGDAHRLERPDWHREEHPDLPERDEEPRR